MRFWKKRIGPVERKGLAQATLRRASHEELVQEALSELAAESGADRIGVWLEGPWTEFAAQQSAFHGSVWDRESESTPPEWRALSPQTILPLSQLLSGLMVKTNFKESESLPLVGPLAGLRAAVWAPVQHAGKLRGILLAGTFVDHHPIRKEQLQRVATELALALAFETEHRIASERHADITLSGRILTGPYEPSRPDSLLREIVESCVDRPGHPDSPRASFALIARVNDSGENQGDTNQAMKVLCLAEEKTAQQYDWESVRILATRALENRRTVGNELSPALHGEKRQRIIAVPISKEGNDRTVLVAGFRPGSATLGSLERIEFRGRLAGTMLSAMEMRETIDGGVDTRARTYRTPHAVAVRRLEADSRRADADRANARYRR